MRVVLLVLLALHLTEGTVYGVIFHHCFTHDQSMRNILSPHSIKRRMRRSAISLGCEAYLFLTETLAILGFLLTTHSASAKDYFALIWCFEFGFKSVFQAMSGQETRDNFLSILVRLDVLCLRKLASKFFDVLCCRVRSRSAAAAEQTNGTTSIQADVSSLSDQTVAKVPKNVD